MIGRIYYILLELALHCCHSILYPTIIAAATIDEYINCLNENTSFPRRVSLSSSPSQRVHAIPRPLFSSRIKDQKRIYCLDPLTHPWKICHSMNGCFFLTMQSFAILYGTCLGCQQVIIARRPLIIVLLVSQRGRKSFTYQSLSNINTTDCYRCACSLWETITGRFDVINFNVHL